MFKNVLSKRLITLLFIIFSICGNSLAAITTSPGSGWLKAGDSLSVTVTFPNNTTAEVTISVGGLSSSPATGSGKAYSAVFSIGPNLFVETVNISATSGDGMTETGTAGFKIDSKNPAPPTITAPVNGTIINTPGDAQIEVTGTASTGPGEAEAVIIFMDGVQVASVSLSNSAFSTNITMPAGKNSVILQAVSVDAAGNTSAPSGTVTISRNLNAPPAPTIISTDPASPVDSSKTELAKVLVTYDISDEANVEKIYLIIDGVAQTPVNIVKNGTARVSPHEFTAVPFPIDKKKLNLQAVVISATGIESAPSAIFTVSRETTPAGVVKVEIDDEDGWVKRQRVKLKIHFNEVMDQTEAHMPIVFLKCQGEGQFGSLLPAAEAGIWSGGGCTFEVSIDITGPSQSIDGIAKLRVQQCYDLSGNGLVNPIVVDTMPQLRIDTSGPKPVLESINPNPETELYTAKQIINIPCTDNIFEGVVGIGLSTDEMEIWVDFDGDGIYQSADSGEKFKERFTFAADSGTGIISWTGSEIRFDPSKTKWLSYRTSPITVQIRNIKDSLGNKISAPYTFTFRLDLDTLTGPTVKFISWNDPQGSDKATTTPPEGWYTKDNQQDVQISVLPDPLTGSAIDLNSVQLTVNGQKYGLKNSTNIFENNGFTHEMGAAPTKEVKLFFKPESVSPSPLTFADGSVVVEIKGIRDAIGKMAASKTRTFKVDTQSPGMPPSINPLSPPPFGVVFKDTLPPVTPTVTIVDTGGAPLNLDSVEISFAGQNSGDLTGQVQISTAYESGSGTTVITLNPMVGVQELSLGDDDYTVSIKKIADAAGNEMSEISWSFYIRSDMGLKMLSFIPNPTGQPACSMEATVQYSMPLPPQAMPVTMMVYNAEAQKMDNFQVAFGGASQSGGNQNVRIRDNLTGLVNGINNISSWLVDSMGNASNAIFHKNAQVNYDIYGPSVPVPYLDPKKTVYSGAVPLKWNAVHDAVKYEVQVAADEGGMSPIRIFTTTGTAIDISMPDTPFSTYYARVRAADLVGNLSPLSHPIKFMVDHTRPEALSIVVEDPTPNSSNTPTYPNSFKAGEILVRITFSEAMDKTVDLSKESRVKIMFHNRDIRPITKGEYISESVWVGSTDPNFIPAELRYSGSLTVSVGGAKDPAGNQMNTTRSTPFFVNNRPKFYTPVIFPNPIDSNDIIVQVKSEEKLGATPAMWVAEMPLEVNAYSDYLFAGTYRLKGMQVGKSNIRISGTNPQGNVGHWPESYDELAQTNKSAPNRFASFVTAAPGRDGSRVKAADESIILDFGPCGVDDETVVYILPYDLNCPPSGGSLAPAKKPGGELVPIGPISQIGATGKLKNPITVSIPDEKMAEYSRNIHREKLGLYRYDGKKWVYLPRDEQDGNGVNLDENSAILSELGPIGVMADIKAPELRGNYPEDGEILQSNKPRISFSFKEEGSGLKDAKLYINDELISPELVKIDHNENQLSFAISRSLSEGAHTMRAFAVDWAGNSIETQTVKFYAPGPFKAETVQVYPVPACDNMTIRTKFNQFAQWIRVDIFDVTGKRVWHDRMANTSGEDFIWYLENEMNDPVANGAYHIRIQAQGDEKITINRKAAVLR